MKDSFARISEQQQKILVGSIREAGLRSASKQLIAGHIDAAVSTLQITSDWIEYYLLEESVSPMKGLK